MADEYLTVRVAEYAALRNEITTFLALQGQFMNYSVILGGVIAGLAIKDRAALTPELLALLPLPFLIFGFLYADAKARILRVALYLQNELRPTLIDPAADQAPLGWETYIRGPSDLKPFLATAERLRWALFFGPVVALFILSYLNPTSAQYSKAIDVLWTVAAFMFLFLLYILFRLETHHEKTLVKDR